MSDVLVIDRDPDPEKPWKSEPVMVRLDGVPPRAKSSGWGDMSWRK